MRGDGGKRSAASVSMKRGQDGLVGIGEVAGHLEQRLDSNWTRIWKMFNKYLKSLASPTGFEPVLPP
jgi:hypothetical protein